MDEDKLRKAQVHLVAAMGGLESGEACAILCDALIFVSNQAGISKVDLLARVSGHWDDRIRLFTEGTERYDS